MIIQCVNCNKKFEVNSSLIPDKGRTIECGSCNHTWFYNPYQTTTSQFSPETKTEKKIDSTKVTKNIEEQKIDTQDVLFSENNLRENVEIKEITKSKTSFNFNIGKILSYLIVCIISFAALILVLDTFKTPLGNIFPSLDLLLYNLFETIKDIILFLKNLFI